MVWDEVLPCGEEEDMSGRTKRDAGIYWRGHQARELKSTRALSAGVA